MTRVPATQTVTPRYVKLPPGDSLSALFPSKEVVRVAAGRRRRYPSLIADAPDTRGIYAGLSDLCRGASSVVDVGCGSGLGTGQLLSRFDRVTAVDADPEAVAFAREYLAGARVLSPEAGPETIGGHDLACVVDVLGHARQPVSVLRLARRLIGERGRVFVAEPRAYPAQALLPPARRAYSRQGLEELLVRSGLEVERWIEGIGQFVACVAAPAAGDEWLSLEAGDQARREGRLEDADACYRRVADGTTGALGREGLLASAVARAERGDLDGVCEQLLRAVGDCPNDARVLSGLSEISLLSGDAMQALALAVRALEDDACNANAVQTLARSANQLQQNDAYASFRLANGLAPTDGATATDLARLATERGELGYAIWVLERLRQFEEDQSVDFHVTLGWLYVNAERVGDALVEADIARVKDPTSVGVRELCTHLDELAVAP